MIGQGPNHATRGGKGIKTFWRPLSPSFQFDASFPQTQIPTQNLQNPSLGNKTRRGGEGTRTRKGFFTEARNRKAKLTSIPACRLHLINSSSSLPSHPEEAKQRVGGAHCCVCKETTRLPNEERDDDTLTQPPTQHRLCANKADSVTNEVAQLPMHSIEEPMQHIQELQRNFDNYGMNTCRLRQ